MHLQSAAVDGLFIYSLSMGAETIPDHYTHRPELSDCEAGATTPIISKVLPVATPTQAGSLCYTNTVAW